MWKKQVARHLLFYDCKNKKRKIIIFILLCQKLSQKGDNFAS